MNYQKHYDTLIDRARTRVLDCYTERHHIVPRCCDGGDEKENIVALTAEEHYVAHQLLVKIHPKNCKLAFAALVMTASNGVNQRAPNKLYGWVRRAAALANKERVFTPEQRAALSKAHTGLKRSAEACRNISDSLKGRVFTQEWKDAISAGKKGKPSSMKGSRSSTETKAKIKEARKHQPVVFGRKHSEESKAKIGAASSQRVCSEQTRQKMRENATGRAPNQATRDKISAANKGKPKTAEHRAKLSASKMGVKMSEDAKAKMRMAHLGKKQSLERIAKARLARKAAEAKRTPEQRTAAAHKAWETKRAKALAQSTNQGAAS